MFNVQYIHHQHTFVEHISKVLLTLISESTDQRMDEQSNICWYVYVLKQNSKDKHKQRDTNIFKNKHSDGLKW